VHNRRLHRCSTRLDNHSSRLIFISIFWGPEKSAVLANKNYY
jgi:hypothetical protein